MKKSIVRFAAFMLPAIVLLNSCGNNGDAIPDVSKEQVQLKTHRFDVDIYAIDTNHIGDGLAKLKTKYPDFLDFFLDTVIGIGVKGNYADTAFAVSKGVREYLCHNDYVGLEHKIQREFPDTKEADSAIANGFRFMKHYELPVHVPQVIYINRILVGSSAFHFDSNLTCVCLDMFLGEEYPFYASVGIPAYMAPHHNKRYLPVAFFREEYEVRYKFNPADRTLLDRLIQRGKEQYFLHKIMPATADSVLFGFRGNQVNWCNKNEANIYNFFVQQNMLYNKEERVVGSYVIDGPYAKGIGSPTDEGNPTPGNVGTWLGYKIVSAYMAANPGTTLKQLLDLQVEPAQFLDKAKYRPGK